MKPKNIAIMTFAILYMIIAPIFVLCIIAKGTNEVFSFVPASARIYIGLIICSIGMGILYGYDQIRDTFMFPTWLKHFSDDNDSPKG